MASPLWADDGYPCVVRLIKTACWKGYQISVQPIDAETEKAMGDPIVLDKNTYQINAPMVCHPNQSISFKASISPPVWANSNTVYLSRNFWRTPRALPPKATQWIVSLCFRRDFSSVPLPPSVKAACQCNFEELPNAENE